MVKTWVRVAAWADVCDLEFTGYPNIKAWIERCEARPATARGLNTPAPYPLRQMLDNIDATVAMGRKFTHVHNPMRLGSA